jgi:hypothetical protein
MSIPDRNDPQRIGDLLAWRCRHGLCVERPLHDHLDWWPAWALETRWST